ncbi:hypothetical protein FB451DRAFT_1164178 [Mycena latifolia]|nr:hypothetical protein FB451DRAFT_1164178 [Mycena latifolia]
MSGLGIGSRSHNNTIGPQMMPQVNDRASSTTKLPRQLWASNKGVIYMVLASKELPQEEKNVPKSTATKRAGQVNKLTCTRQTDLRTQIPAQVNTSQSARAQVNLASQKRTYVVNSRPFTQDRIITLSTLMPALDTGRRLFHEDGGRPPSAVSDSDHDCLSLPLLAPQHPLKPDDHALPLARHSISALDAAACGKDANSVVCPDL